MTPSALPSRQPRLKETVNGWSYLLIFGRTVPLPAMSPLSLWLIRMPYPQRRTPAHRPCLTSSLPSAARRSPRSVFLDHGVGASETVLPRFASRRKCVHTQLLLLKKTSSSRAQSLTFSPFLPSYLPSLLFLLFFLFLFLSFLSFFLSLSLLLSFPFRKLNSGTRIWFTSHKYLLDNMANTMISDRRSPLPPGSLI